MKSAIIVFPGSNREGDLAIALEKALGRKPALVWHTQTSLPPGTDLVTFPGGFSYGDYLRCGAIAARSPAMQAVRQHAEAGGLVVGICNGFQILCETQLLPGILVRNAGLKFICKDVHLKVERNDTPFSSAYSTGEIIRVPVAHGEGNYTADSATLERLEGEGRVLFRYVNETGQAVNNANINGSANSIAGILNEKGNVLGMMPHPENAIEPAHGSIGGFGLFASLTAALKKVA